MKIKVTVEIEVPDGATHYTGELTIDPVWFKRSPEGIFIWHVRWCEWIKYPHAELPSWAKELNILEMCDD